MVQVTYQGGGMDGVTSNAASEATLQLLLKAISGQGGNTGGAQGAFDGANAKGMIGANKAQTKATKQNTFNFTEPEHLCEKIVPQIKTSRQTSNQAPPTHSNIQT